VISAIKLLAQFWGVIFSTLQYKEVSCYAFFKGWLLPSLPPTLFPTTITFPTYHVLSTLQYDLGCCPLDVTP